MRNKKVILSALLFSVFTTTQAQTTGDLFKSLAKQTLKAVVVSNAPAVTLSPKPAALTQLPRVGPSELFVTPEIRERMGGSEITTISRQRIHDLLVSAGRFNVSDDVTSPYRFIATVTDFQGYEVEMKGKSAATALANQFLKANINANQAPINWEKDESLVSIKCSVSLNFEDSRSRELLFSGQGTFERKSLLSALRAEISAFEAARKASTTGSVQSPARMTEHELKAALVELGAQQALKDMLPKLDAYLLGLQPTSSTAAASQTAQPAAPAAAEPVKAAAIAPAPEPAKTVAAAISPEPAKPVEPPAVKSDAAAAKPKFCTNCGNRLEGEHKFCGNCGTPVKR